MSAVAVPVGRRGPRLVVDSAYVTGRSLRAFVRQPAFVGVTLVQPMIWLLLFGQLFRRIVELPGFGGGSYLEYLTPGVVVMTALFSSGWSGTTFIDDMNRGVMDRLLVSPVRRGALIVGSLAYQSVSSVIQSVIVIVVGIACGARYPGGLLGSLVTVASAVLLTVAFASLSNAFALLLRSQEALIGMTQFLVLPLSFLSSAIMSSALAPRWVQDLARWNPVDWAAVASRQALSAHPDWAAVSWRLAGLAVLAVVVALAATQAFRSYQRSV